ncbi:MAG: beta strand repeat-containing protein [Isosphaeraceae bacterium]
MTLTPINISGLTVVSQPVVMNGELFFVGYDAVHGDQLWESNGTAAGTVRVSDGNDGNGGINPTDLTVVGNTLYFAADNLTNGDQLWKSNGTASGTTMVTDSNGGIDPTDLTDFNGTLYFAGFDSNDGTQLFTSDGTAAGTTIVLDIAGPTGANSKPGSYPSDLTAVGGLLYFEATSASSGSQLWATNGTASGTTMLTSGDAANGGISPQFLIAMGNTLYFNGFDPTNGFQLWSSTGTAAGTVTLTSGGASSLGLDPQELTAVGNTLYFSGTDGVHGTQLWSFAGTTPGAATMLTSANVSGGGVAPTDLTAVGSTLYFIGDNGVDGDQLWSSTGTASGTAMFIDINGTTTSDPADLIDVDGTLYFTAYTTANGFQVWQSNGTANGTVMDTSFDTGLINSLANFASVGSSLYFTTPAALSTSTPPETASMWQWQPAASPTPTITWAAPANIVYGTALGTTQLDATASYTVDGSTVSVPGNFTYSPAAGTVLGAGNGQTLFVTFTPTDTTNYSANTATTTINVQQATPTITWANPASLVYGTPLGGTQLDATASDTVNGSTVSVPGTFSYSPAAGAVLAVGNGQTLSVVFTPTDTTDYKSTSATATINVLTATPTPTPTSTPTPAPTPTIKGEQIVLTYLKHNKKGKPIGKPVVNIMIDYSIPMNSGTADNASNYQVDWVSTKKVKKKVQTILHPIGVLSATSNASNTAVTLATSATNAKFAKGGQLTIIAAAPGGVDSAAGVYLAGNNIFTITAKAGSIEPS